LGIVDQDGGDDRPSDPDASDQGLGDREKHVAIRVGAFEMRLPDESIVVAWLLAIQEAGFDGGDDGELCAGEWDIGHEVILLPDIIAQKFYL
jgi:hypothetical protein